MMKRITTFNFAFIMILAACGSVSPALATSAPTMASVTSSPLPPTSTSTAEATAAMTDTLLPSTSASEPELVNTDPQTVFIAYYSALIAGNLDAAMALVADEGLSFCYADPCFTKKEDVRGFWQGEFHEGWVPYVSILKVDGDTVTYAFTAVQRGRVDVWGSGKVVVESGKIKSDH